MARPALYSPDISQHSHRLYRLGLHFGVPMTVLADRLIRYGLQNLDRVMPEESADEDQAIGLVAEPQASYGGSSIKRKVA